MFVITWPPWRVDGEPEDERLARRGNDDGLEPGGSANAPVEAVLVLLAIRIGLELRIVGGAVGGEAPGALGSGPELRRDRRDGLREANPSLL